MFILAGMLGALAAGFAAGLLGDGDDNVDVDEAPEGDDIPKPDADPQVQNEGTSPLDMIVNGAGELLGGDGDDVMTGSAGRDDLTGGDGDDTLYGMGDDDWLFGDDAPGAAGDDLLFGGEGDDTLVGNGGSDRLFGGLDDDKLFGGDGDDTLQGGAGHDELMGSAGDDVLFGGEGDDDLTGGLGDDVLSGGKGADFVHGGAGDDTLFGSGDDWLDGNDGDDLFSLDPDKDRVTSIGDFTDGDRIEIAVDHPGAVLTITHDADGNATLLIDGAAVARVMNAEYLTEADITLIVG